MSCVIKWRKWQSVLAFLPLVTAATAMAATPRLPKPGLPVAEMPMAVSTEGTTYEEYVRHQEDLFARLSSETPAPAMVSAVQVQISSDERDQIEQMHSTPGTPLQIGIVKPIEPAINAASFSQPNSVKGLSRAVIGELETTADGGFVWAIAVSSPGAGAIRVHIEGMSLPNNAELYFYSPAGEAFGPYIAEGQNLTGEFWTESVFGSEGILQLRLNAPADAEDLADVAFRVTEVGHIGARFVEDIDGTATAAAAFCGNETCIVDATCHNGTPADPAKNAVAKYEWIAGPFIYTCSGGLIADGNSGDSNWYFLTANHCISKNNHAGNAQFYWRFATSICNGACPSNNGWPFKTTGSTVSRTGRRGDFTLLHLNTIPPSGSVFLGWTSAPIANTNGADLFRISNPNFGPQVYSRHDVSTTAPTCSGWPRGERIYSKDALGATDGGSSGSPVVNGSSQIVGQLSGACGTDPSNPCNSAANATVDGAFAYYYSQIAGFLAP